MSDKSNAPLPLVVVQWVAALLFITSFFLELVDDLIGYEAAFFMVASFLNATGIKGSEKFEFAFMSLGLLCTLANLLMILMLFEPLLRDKSWFKKALIGGFLTTIAANFLLLLLFKMDQEFFLNPAYLLWVGSQLVLYVTLSIPWLRSTSKASLSQ